MRKWSIELGDARHREAARANLEQITDPLAVPSIVRAFARGSTAAQKLAITLLKQIDAPLATNWLARLAVWPDDPQVRAAAAEGLKGREPRDYAGQLVSLIHAPMTYQAKPVGGPGSQGSLVIDSPRFRITRTYDAPPAFKLSSNFHGYVGYAADGMPLVMSGNDLDQYNSQLNHYTHKEWHFGHSQQLLAQAEQRTAAMLADAQIKAEIARERLAADIRDIEIANAQGEMINQRAETALRIAMEAPASLGVDDEDGWNSWYYDRIGYRYSPPPKVYAAINAAPT